MINNAINSLLSFENLTRVEMQEAFDEILSGLSDEIIASSFITSLKAKGETLEEIVSAIVASKDSIKNRLKFELPENSIECVNFLDTSNYIDIFFLMDIILSANNVPTLKYQFNSTLYKNNSFDTFKSFGLNNALDFEKTNFMYYDLSLEEPYFKYTNQIKRKLNFDNILNITDKMLNPYNAKNQLLAVKSKEDVEKFANIALNLNNLNTLTTYADKKVPFVSIEGDTYIAEAWKNKVFTYTVNPSLLEIKENSLDSIKCENIEHNKEIILNILNGKIKDSYYDVTVINSAFALYITKKVSSILEGINCARDTINSLKAFEKLQQLQEK